MDWGKFSFCLAVPTPDLEWIRVIVPFALWDLRIEGRNVQLLALRGRITSETGRVQAYSIIHDTWKKVVPVNPHTSHRKCQRTETSSKSRAICSFNSLAQSFNRWQYLLSQIIIVIYRTGRISDRKKCPKEPVSYLSGIPYQPS